MDTSAPQYPFFYFSPLPPPPPPMNTYHQEEEEKEMDKQPLLSQVDNVPTLPFAPFPQQMYGYPAFIPPMNQPLYIRLPNGQFQMVTSMPQPPHALHQVSVQENKKNENKLKNSSLACLITFIIGFFTFFTHFVSIILSLRIISKTRKNITNTKAWIVIILSVIELISWIACATLAWRTSTECFEYSDETYYSNIQITCENHYYGWIAIVAWFEAALVCGIPRVIMTRQAARAKQQSGNDF